MLMESKKTSLALPGRPDRGRPHARRRAVDGWRPAHRRGAVMSPISRGFRGRRADADPRGCARPIRDPRLPCSPRVRRRTRRSSGGLLDRRRGGRAAALDVDEFRALPSEEISRDIHCVTKWSKLDTLWQGVFHRHVARRDRDRGGLRHPVLATAVTRPICRSRTSPAARRGWRSPTR